MVKKFFVEIPNVIQPWSTPVMANVKQIFEITIDSVWKWQSLDLVNDSCLKFKNSIECAVAMHCLLHI